MIFDNYQEAPDDSLFHEVLHNGLDVTPEGVNVIVISRNEPPPVFERMRANRLMSIVSWEDLRLNLNEFRGIIRHKGQKKMAKEVITRLHSKIEGWAAGLMLVLEKLTNEEKPTQSFNKLEPEVVFDYFAGEIFQKLDRETQDVLVKTSLFLSMTQSMVKDLTGIDHGERVLSKLNRENFFTERSQSEGETVYQYHGMFREFLLSHAEELYTSKELLRLRQKAAEILEVSGRIEEAAELFIPLLLYNP